jgi:protein-S-isoprenylcysteine O-methyltransferase Ste14
VGKRYFLAMDGGESLFRRAQHRIVRVGFGRWSAWLSSPQTHRLHHSSLPEHRDCNFAQFFTVFDLLGGTYRQPTLDEYPPTGLDSAEIPNTVHGMFLWRWRRQLHLPVNNKPGAGSPAKHSVMIRNRLLASALRIGSTAILVMAFGLMAYTSYRKFTDSGSVNMLGLCAVNTVFVALFISRRDATSISTSPSVWLIAFGGTFLPLLMRPNAAGPFTMAGDAIQFVGMLGIIASLLSLRRSFGIVPANRGIRTQGLYNVVRHPVYASELLTLGAFAIVSPSLWNVSLWFCEFALQLARAYAEERLLSKDPCYVQYRWRVKYRLIPLVI